MSHSVEAPIPAVSELTIPVVLGSVRARRLSERPARLIVERLSALGCQAPLVDLRTLDLPLFGQDRDRESASAVGELQAVAASSDAMVWLTPEYNHSFTSATKNAVDFLHSEIRR